ncbi:MAG: FKBP-type peptidyl-prolyl cis-trans isomerase [Burkholderiaceae bacterium]|jgi:FKBP-type peptidyl-prolyl cis-trans isomerase|nr:FKBP-type peptidyl-prolyl cis-trans isomerase [Burkholderiaceae bacterium]
MTQNLTELTYTDEAVGNGIEAGKGSSFLTVHYTVWLMNPDGSTGDKVDCSRERDQPFTFPFGVRYVIRGWDEGIKGMRVGGRRILRIPSHMGYGSSGAGSKIPPHTNLIFDVELLSA